jgi:hypothetical protein
MSRPQRAAAANAAATYAQYAAAEQSSEDEDNQEHVDKMDWAADGVDYFSDKAVAAAEADEQAAAAAADSSSGNAVQRRQMHILDQDVRSVLEHYHIYMPEDLESNVRAW